jgi:hypothetical protein
MVRPFADPVALFGFIADSSCRQDLLRLWVSHAVPVAETRAILTVCSPIVVAEDMIGVAMYELVRGPV